MKTRIMKNNDMKLIAVMLTALTVFPSCGKADGNFGGEGASAEVEIIDPDKGTDELQTEDEKSIRNLDVAVYDENGELEWSHRYKTFPKGRIVVTGIAGGEKTIAVAANVTDMEIPFYLYDFQHYVSELNDNDDGFVMSGFVKCEARPGPEPVKVALRRLAAKVALSGNISVRWSGDPPESFDIKAVYLANVSVESDLSGDSTTVRFINRRNLKSYTDDEKFRTLTVAQKREWNPGGKFNGGTSLYCYPNATELRTALMILAAYDGEECWYPLVIDRNIRSNTLYVIGNVVITGKGNDDPEEDYEKLSFEYDVSLEEWKYEQLIQEMK